jgi:hypothetical protein
MIAVFNESKFYDIFLGFLEKFGISNKFASAVLPIFCEVTSGCYSAVSVNNASVLISFALGWAGICVHFQIYSIMTDIEFSKAKFTLWRLIHGALAALISYVLFRLNPITIAAFRDNSNIYSPLKAYTFTSGSLALILLCAFFLSGLSSKNIIRNDDI